LHEGLRVANITMAESEAYDVGRLPIYQWLASYAHANAQLFLGGFEHAATLLGERWRKSYLALSESDREELIGSVEALATLNPIAAVGRHILLASAFAGKALMKSETNPNSKKMPPSKAEWARAWFHEGLKLGQAERITQDFTRAYMALYCLLVEEADTPHRDGELDRPLSFLEEIHDDAPPVSQYAKYGVQGIVLMSRGRYPAALSSLRRADTQSRMSGNRFFDGMLLPAHATVAMLSDVTHAPEAGKLMRRARQRAQLARSAFYDSQIDAARAVLEAIAGHKGKARQLMARACQVDHGLMPLYKKLGERRGR